jgi:hypothetical protein
MEKLRIGRKRHLRSGRGNGLILGNKAQRNIKEGRVDVNRGADAFVCQMPGDSPGAPHGELAAEDFLSERDRKERFRLGNRILSGKVASLAVSPGSDAGGGSQGSQNGEHGNSGCKQRALIGTGKLHQDTAAPGLTGLLAASDTLTGLVLEWRGNCCLQPVRISSDADYLFHDCFSLFKPLH